MYEWKSTIGPIGGDSIYKLYIDTYFLFNLWMNLWVLFLCRFFAARNVKSMKIVITAFIMALGEVLILCIPYGNRIVKIILGFGGIMALGNYWLFRPKTGSAFCKLLLNSYLAIFLLGGFMIFMESVWGKKSVSGVSKSIWAVCGVVLIEVIYRKIKIKNDFYQVILTIAENQKCQVTALRDSGNGLIEPISKVPVSVVEERQIRPYKAGFREDRFRVVPFHSIGRETGILDAYFIDKMEIINEGESLVIMNPIIAITKDRISTGENYQMILHPSLLEQGGKNSDI